MAFFSVWLYIGITIINVNEKHFFKLLDFNEDKANKYTVKGAGALKRLYVASNPAGGECKF